MGKVQGLIKEWNPQPPSLGTQISRKHSPYYNSTGPIVKEGFVAARIRAFQSKDGESAIPFRSRSPMTPCPKPWVRHWEIRTPPRGGSTQTPATVGRLRERGHTLDCLHEKELSLFKKWEKTELSAEKASALPPPLRVQKDVPPPNIQELSASPTPKTKPTFPDHVFHEYERSNYKTGPLRQSSDIVSPQALPPQMVNAASLVRSLQRRASLENQDDIAPNLKSSRSIADKLSSMVEHGWVSRNESGKDQEKRKLSEPLPPRKDSNARRIRRSQSESHEGQREMPIPNPQSFTQIVQKERQRAIEMVKQSQEPHIQRVPEKGYEFVSDQIGSSLGLPGPVKSQKRSFSRRLKARPGDSEGTELDFLEPLPTQDRLTPESNGPTPKSRQPSVASTTSVRSLPRKASTWFQMYRPRLFSTSKITGPRPLSRKDSATSDTQSPDGAQDVKTPFIEPFPPLFGPTDEPANWFQPPQKPLINVPSPIKRSAMRPEEATDRRDSELTSPTKTQKSGSKQPSFEDMAAVADSVQSTFTGNGSLLHLSNKGSGDSPKLSRQNSQQNALISGSRHPASSPTTSPTTASAYSSPSDSKDGVSQKNSHSVNATEGSQSHSSHRDLTISGEGPSQPEPSGEFRSSPSRRFQGTAQTSAANVHADLQVQQVQGSNGDQEGRNNVSRGIKRVQVTISFDGTNDVMFDADLSGKAKHGREVY